jgi:hypothetical protein
MSDRHLCHGRHTCFARDSTLLPMLRRTSCHGLCLSIPKLFARAETIPGHRSKT